MPSRRPTVRTRRISDYRQDANNANRGTEIGRGMLEHSLRTFGIGRPILSDRDDVLIAGNKTLEAAAAIGIEEVIEIETTGNAIIVHKRGDLDLNEPMAQALGVADNRVGQMSLDWNPEIVAAINARVSLSPFFNEDTIEAMRGVAAQREASEGEGGESSGQEITTQTFIVVTCNNERHQRELLERFMREGLTCRALNS
jgi:hypothetical protein